MHSIWQCVIDYYTMLSKTVMLPAQVSSSAILLEQLSFTVIDKLQDLRLNSLPEQFSSDTVTAPDILTPIAQNTFSHALVNSTSSLSP